MESLSSTETRSIIILRHCVIGVLGLRFYRTGLAECTGSYTIRLRCLAKSSSRSHSANFVSARIPLIALADILAAAVLHGSSANQTLYVKDSVYG